MVDQMVKLTSHLHLEQKLRELFLRETANCYKIAWWSYTWPKYTRMILLFVTYLIMLQPCVPKDLPSY